MDKSVNDKRICIRMVNVYLTYQRTGMGIASHAGGDISLKTPLFL
jgi:hypothetical protein